AAQLPAAVVENTASLLDAQGQVLNGDTVSGQLGIAPSAAVASSASRSSAYLFVHDGQALATTDGLVQEIVSPGRSDRVTVLVTGLDDTALIKAARSLSSENRFPSMWSTH